MKSKFKYRFWDVKKKEMIEWNDEFFSDMSEVTSYSGSISYIKEEYLMQYTGVTDCNSKEICEADLVKVDLGGQRNREIEVEFIKGAFGVKLLKRTMYTDKEYYDFIPLYNIDSEDIEVVGNKYEGVNKNEKK